MPAGRIFNATAVTRYVRRRRYKRPSRFRKAVSAIAKKAVLRMDETKIAVTNHTVNFGSSGHCLVTNATRGLLNDVVTGTLSQQRIGDQIRLQGIKFRFNIYIDPGIYTAQREFAGFRILLVSNKNDQLLTSDFPTYTSTIDPEKMTVLMEKYVKLSGTNWSYTFNKYLKYDRLIRYVATNAIKNVYFWVVPSPLGTGLGLSTGYSLSGTQEVYYKDP